MSKRAIRRHHRARVVARAVNIRRLWWYPSPAEEDELKLVAAKYADHLAACSCSMCGNPRRHGGFAGPRLTRQERVADLRFAEEIEELWGCTIDSED